MNAGKNAVNVNTCIPSYEDFWRFVKYWYKMLSWRYTRIRGTIISFTVAVIS